MNLFADVSFGPAEVRAVAEGKSLPRCTLFAVLTSQTCGEPCWHAREEICRCSCGGKNHGCLLVPGGAKPERTAKIDGNAYRLLAVGLWRDLIAAAKLSNGRAWRSLEKPELIVDGRSRDDAGNRFTQADADKARAAGETAYWHQYRYSWSETDAGAPARLKTASADQLARWTELRGWQDRAREGVYILWERLEMPAAPAILTVNRETGEPLVNQSPIGEQV